MKKYRTLTTWSQQILPSLRIFIFFFQKIFALSIENILQFVKVKYHRTCLNLHKFRGQSYLHWLSIWLLLIILLLRSTQESKPHAPSYNLSSLIKIKMTVFRESLKGEEALHVPPFWKYVTGRNLWCLKLWLKLIYNQWSFNLSTNELEIFDTHRGKSWNLKTEELSESFSAVSSLFCYAKVQSLCHRDILNFGL